MKTLSPALEAHLSLGQTTLAYLLKVKRKDGTVLAFTSLDRDMTYDDGTGDGNVLYKTKAGLLNSAASSKSDLSVDNLEISAFLSDDQITEEDLRAHRYDDSDILFILVNWADLTQGHMVIRRATLGIVKIVKGLFTAELRGQTHKLTSLLGGTYGTTCRAEFGSGLNGIDMNSRWLCKVDVAALRQTGSVDQIEGGAVAFLGARVVTPAGGLTGAAGWFNDGIITFTSGANNGLVFEIRKWDGADLTLFETIPFILEPGDTFTIEPGCNKTAGDCKNKFDNIVNMRAELFMPGMDRFTDVPGIRV